MDDMYFNKSIMHYANFELIELTEYDKGSIEARYRSGNKMMNNTFIFNRTHTVATFNNSQLATNVYKTQGSYEQMERNKRKETEKAKIKWW